MYFVLAYNGSDQRDDHVKKREIFEANLEHEGLQLERDKTQNVHFVLIHAPKEVLCRYAEILKIKMPMKVVCISVCSGSVVCVYESTPQVIWRRKKQTKFFDKEKWISIDRFQLEYRTSKERKSVGRCLTSGRTGMTNFIYHPLYGAG